jgi:uncharacterized protein
MAPNLTDALCTRCGLCCDGSLFADVELSGPAEATRMEAMGLAVEEDDADDALLLQPCRALRGTRCGAYAHRPECCRTFECRLLQDVRRGAADVPRARRRIAETRRRIRRVEELLTRLGRRDARLPLGERCAEALAADSGPSAERTRARLEAAMSAVQDMLRETFLEGPRRPHTRRA